MNPALSRSLALSHVKLCDALEIRGGIINIRFLFRTATCLISQVSYMSGTCFFFHSLLGNPSLPACATCTNPCGETTTCGTLGGCNMDSSSRVLGWHWSRHSLFGELSSPKRWSQIRCVRKPALFVTVSMLVPFCISIESLLLLPNVLHVCSVSDIVLLHTLTRLYCPCHIGEKAGVELLVLL